jgi:hypothetical protein
LYRDEKHPVPLFTLNFPFGDKQENVEVKYMDKTVPISVIQSTDATQKMGRDSVVDLYVYLKNLKIDSGNTISVQRSVFSLVKVRKYVPAGGSAGASGAGAGAGASETGAGGVTGGSITGIAAGSLGFVGSTTGIAAGSTGCGALVLSVGVEFVVGSIFFLLKP